MQLGDYKYFHIDRETGEVMGCYLSKGEAKEAEEKFNRSSYELIDEEELFYRRVAWLGENGYEDKDVQEDEDGEYVLVENHNYAHPTDEGANVTVDKEYITYELRGQSFNEAYKQAYGG